MFKLKNLIYDVRDLMRGGQSNDNDTISDGRIVQWLNATRAEVLRKNWMKYSHETYSLEQDPGLIVPTPMTLQDNSRYTIGDIKLGAGEINNDNTPIGPFYDNLWTVQIPKLMGLNQDADIISVRSLDGANTVALNNHQSSGWRRHLKFSGSKTHNCFSGGVDSLYAHNGQLVLRTSGIQSERLSQIDADTGMYVQAVDTVQLQNKLYKYVDGTKYPIYQPFLRGSFIFYNPLEAEGLFNANDPNVVVGDYENFDYPISGTLKNEMMEKIVILYINTTQQTFNDRANNNIQEKDRIDSNSLLNNANK